MFLKYACASHYSLTGPEHVYCQSNRQWTQLPTCKGENKPMTLFFKKSLSFLEMIFKYVSSFLSYFVLPDSFCFLDPDRHPDLSLTGPMYLQDNTQDYIPCIWLSDPHSAFVQCINKKLTVHKCKYPSLCFSDQPMAIMSMNMNLAEF